MCTIVALHGMRADLPLVIAANRDELYAREATGPQRLLEAPVTVGGRDVLGGGTWMGVTAAGLVVAVTNQRSAGVPAPHARSRGALVMAALQAARSRRSRRCSRRPMRARTTRSTCCSAMRAGCVWRTRARSRR